MPISNRTFLFSSKEALTKADGKYRVQVLRTGSWNYRGKSLKITPDDLRELKQNFDNKVYYPCPVDGPARGGECHDKSDLADCGFTKALTLSDDGHALYADFDVTEAQVKAMVDEGSLAYCSAEFHQGWPDPADGNKPKKTFMGFGLTNRPFLTGMEPVTINFSQEGNQSMTEAEIAALKADNERLKKEAEEARLLKLSQDQGHIDPVKFKQQEAEIERLKNVNAQNSERIEAMEASQRETSNLIKFSERKATLQKKAAACGMPAPIMGIFLKAYEVVGNIGTIPGIVTLSSKMVVEDGKDETDRYDLNQMLDKLVDAFPVNKSLVGAKLALEDRPGEQVDLVKLSSSKMVEAAVDGKIELTRGDMLNGLANKLMEEDGKTYFNYTEALTKAKEMLPYSKFKGKVEAMVVDNE